MGPLIFTKCWDKKIPTGAQKVAAEVFVYNVTFFKIDPKVNNIFGLLKKRQGLVLVLQPDLSQKCTPEVYSKVWPRFAPQKLIKKVSRTRRNTTTTPKTLRHILSAA